MVKAQGWRNGLPLDIELIVVDEEKHLLEKAAGQAYQNMAAAAKLGGVLLRIVSAFRSHEHQQRLWVEYQEALSKRNSLPLEKRDSMPRPVGRPGFSKHESGSAVDLDVSNPNTLKWLRENAKLQDYYNTVSVEPWHWEYIP